MRVCVIEIYLLKFRFIAYHWDSTEFCKYFAVLQRPLATLQRSFVTKFPGLTFGVFRLIFRFNK